MSETPPTESSRAETPRDAEVRLAHVLWAAAGWIAFAALFGLWIWSRP